jgi:cytochrome c-type biogenesis protein CcmF
LFPIISEAWDGNKIHIGASYFNQLNVPIGIVLLFLMGIGPLLSWKNTSSSTLISNLSIPMIFSFISGLFYMIFTDEFKIYPFITSMGIVFTLTSIMGELKKSFKSSYSNNNSLPKALLQLLSKNRHKNGGYIVHIGITLLFVGFVGRAFEVEKEFVLSPGETIYFANHVFRLNNVTSEERDNHYAFISDMDVLDANNSNAYITTLYPEKRIYFHRNPDPEKRQPHSELDIYRTMSKDIYSIFSSYDAQKKEAYFKIMINPLVNWVWIGGIVIIFGALFAFWPSSRRNYGTI